jgi:hypothetical protein
VTPIRLLERVGGTCGGRKQSRWRFCWLPTALFFSDASEKVLPHRSAKQLQKPFIAHMGAPATAGDRLKLYLQTTS